ncbi:prokineticin-2 [Xiphophorus hellerii]|uniref:prokineticin-2 n=1 Tax=Xiphophorus hellerii TaxID=8084 RepID=UPI0013B469FF|nr:prokineticin-2 [Xiphophorus hellerii]
MSSVTGPASDTSLFWTYQASNLMLIHLGLVSPGWLLQACEKDSQCGGGTCCAVSLWIHSLRVCMPMGQEGADCHSLSHKVPFFGKRLHHTCPCLPNLSCVAIGQGKAKCLSPYEYPEYFF